MIYVCSLEAFPALAAQVGPSHVVSMLADDEFPVSPPSVRPGNHLCLSFHDITTPLPGHRPPAPEHVEQLIAFGESWDGSAPLISHCFAGVSRSSAAAFIFLCMRHPGDERLVARRMRAEGGHFQPNRLMVELADQMLGSGGRMLDALDEMGLADPLAPHRYVLLPAELA